MYRPKIALFPITFTFTLILTLPIGVFLMNTSVHFSSLNQSLDAMLVKTAWF